MSKHTMDKQWTAKIDSVRHQVCMDDGTWFYSTSCRVYNSHDQQVAEVSSFHNEDGSPHRAGCRISESEVQPVAHLVAAAPELLEALKRLSSPDMGNEDMDFALAAIAKATGGEG